MKFDKMTKRACDAEKNIIGEIPLKVLPRLSSAEISLPKSPVADIYKQIETDLQEAVKVLPKTYSGPDLGRAV